MHKISVISAGPGGKGYITLNAREKVKSCDVVIGTGIQLASVETVSSQIVYEESSIDKILDLIAEHEGSRIGVLVTGDAGVYSLAQKIIQRFGKDAVEEIVPGVSSIQLAFARIKEPWLNVQVFSYHGRPLERLEDILTHERVAVLCDREHNSRVILSGLERIGLFEREREIYICQDLSMESERVVEIRSPEDIEGIEPARREIILILVSQG